MKKRPQIWALEVRSLIAQDRIGRWLYDPSFHYAFDPEVAEWLSFKEIWLRVDVTQVRQLQLIFRSREDRADFTRTWLRDFISTPTNDLMMDDPHGL